ELFLKLTSLIFLKNKDAQRNYFCYYDFKNKYDITSLPNNIYNSIGIVQLRIPSNHKLQKNVGL
ncbi:MAG: hypothetical protein QNK57_05150, partial [Flavobacteriales bacterium]